MVTALGFKPLEKQPPATPAQPTFSVSSTNQSGGVTAGQYFESPPKRSLSTGTTREGLLSLLRRKGAKVEVVALADPEALQFEFEVERFLDSKGFKVLDPANLGLGGRPFFGQNVYELDGVYVIEIGSDDGNRVWKHGPSMTAEMFHTPRNFANLPPIDRRLLDEHAH